jgi:predicted transcriptional regulator
MLGLTIYRPWFSVDNRSGMKKKDVCGRFSCCLITITDMRGDCRAPVAAQGVTESACPREASNRDGETGIVKRCVS